MHVCTPLHSHKPICADIVLGAPVLYITHTIQLTFLELLVSRLSESAHTYAYTYVHVFVCACMCKGFNVAMCVCTCACVCSNTEHLQQYSNIMNANTL